MRETIISMGIDYGTPLGFYHNGVIPSYRGSGPRCWDTFPQQPCDGPPPVRCGGTTGPRRHLSRWASHMHPPHPTVFGKPVNTVETHDGNHDARPPERRTNTPILLSPAPRRRRRAAVLPPRVPAPRRALPHHSAARSTCTTTHRTPTRQPINTGGHHRVM
jgi:hypothetical protein